MAYTNGVKSDSDIKTELDNLVSAVAALKAQFNLLFANFIAHVHTGVSTGTASTSLTNITSATSISATVPSSLFDDRLRF